MTMDGPRALQAHEFDALMELIDDTFRGPDWPRPTQPSLYSLLLNPKRNLEGMRVFVDHGRPVSHFGFYVRTVFCGGASLRVASVGSVCTHPDYRGQGLATRLMQDALQLCRRRGVHVMLISGDRGLYRRQGACELGSLIEVMFTSGAFPTNDAIRLERWCDEALPLCAALYQREPFRFYRSLEDWQRIVRGGSDMNREVETLLIYEFGNLRAYAAVYAPEDGSSGYLEAVGSRQALCSAIPACMRRVGADRFSVCLPSSDVGWLSLVQHERHVERTMPGYTALLVDIPGLIDALEPYLIERLGERTRTIRWEVQPPFRIASADGSLELGDRATLTQLILGPHTPSLRSKLEEAQALGRLLRLAFPLLWNHPGLNFV